MRALALFLILCTTGAMAQQQPSELESPRSSLTESAPPAYRYAASYKDVYCAGFVTRAHFNSANHLVGGAASNEVVHFAMNDTVFLAGSGYQIGERYAVIRAERDPNLYQAFRGQNKHLEQLGQLYAELGHVRVTSLENGYAVANVEVSCEPMVPGDLLVPFQDKGSFIFEPRTTPFPVFGVPIPPVPGHVIGAAEFDTLFTTRQHVYINLGSNAGLRPGDYLRIMRSPAVGDMFDVDKITLASPSYDDTQRHPMQTPDKSLKTWPAKGLGEMMVISVTPETATCIVTMALEELQIGDVVAPEKER